MTMKRPQAPTPPATAAQPTASQRQTGSPCAGSAAWLPLVLMTLLLGCAPQAPETTNLNSRASAPTLAISPLGVTPAELPADHLAQQAFDWLQQANQCELYGISCGEEEEDEDQDDKDDCVFERCQVTFIGEIAAIYDLDANGQLRQTSVTPNHRNHGPTASMATTSTNTNTSKGYFITVPKDPDDSFGVSAVRYRR